MVQGTTYKNIKTSQYITADQYTTIDQEVRANDYAVFYEKMSKSKYNGVEPQAVLGKYGADTARMFILFKAPPEKDLEWDDADVEGLFRFLNRVWRLVYGFVQQPERPAAADVATERAEKDVRRAIHTAIKEISEDIEEGYQFNTAISELMKLTNSLSEATLTTAPIYAEGLQILVRLLAPFAPHIAEELWQALGYADSVHQQPWPRFDPAALVADTITVVIQINGRKRGEFEAPADVSQEQQEALALANEATQRYLAEGTLRKTIVVPQKIVNFVVN